MFHTRAFVDKQGINWSSLPVRILTKETWRANYLTRKAPKWTKLAPHLTPRPTAKPSSQQSAAMAQCQWHTMNQHREVASSTANLAGSPPLATGCGGRPRRGASPPARRRRTVARDGGPFTKTLLKSNGPIYVHKHPYIFIYPPPKIDRD